MKRRFLFLVVTLSAGLSAQASLNISSRSGEVHVLDVTQRPAEVCVVPMHATIAKYRASDRLDETKLCDYDIGKNIVACPKLYNTNPAVLFQSIAPGATKMTGSESACEDLASKKLAKLKFSIGCSYAPSLLAYYHISRMLGNILNVPVAVLRTLDLVRHREIIKRAIDKLQPSTAPIGHSWAAIGRKIENGSDAPGGDQIFVLGGEQTFGALQANPRGEDVYPEFKVANQLGDDRIANFKISNAVYLSLQSKDLTIGKEWNQKNIQTLKMLKDAADMILIDTLLGQQDRIGNIHSVNRFYYRDAQHSNIIKTSETLPAVPENFQNQAVSIREMMLKDNDCGITTPNLNQKNHLIEGIAHFDSETYHALKLLAKSMDSQRSFYSDVLQLSERDHAKLKSHAKAAIEVLKSSCRKGKLKFDLNLERHFNGGGAAANCL